MDMTEAFSSSGACAPTAPERSALLASVDIVPVSDELKERWRIAARDDSRLRLPVFFVRCADMGYACLPTLLRRAFAEKNVAFDDLRFVYQTLGSQHADAQRMIFGPDELAGMETDELLAVTEYSLENFLDIYRFMPSMQAKKAEELGRIAAEAAEKARAARAALDATEPGSAAREDALRELSTQYFIEKLASSIEEEENA